jgi:glycosyltransferase involved in cell wall biosynthesis
MRILFVHENFGSFGGAEANVLTTAQELQNRGHEVQLIYEKTTGKEVDSWNETFFLKTSRAQFYDKSVTEISKPDLIYLHKYSDLKVLKTLLNSGIPMVRMIHDHELYCMRGSKYNVWNRKVCHRSFSGGCLVPCGAFIGRKSGSLWPLKWVSYSKKSSELKLSRECHLFIVASEYMKQELIHNGFPNEKIVIHPPVPSLKRDVQKKNRGKNIILYVGQITRGKGLDLLIKALSHLKTDYQCVVVGTGNFQSYCENLAWRLGLKDKVLFTGFLSPQQIESYYKQADIFVLSSIWPEPFGLVGLEAMSHALPVVAFDVGGVKEWLIHDYNGILCKELTSKCLSSNIRKLLSDKRMAEQMGENGAAFFEKNFSFANYIQGLEEIMRGVVFEDSYKVAV